VAPAESATALLAALVMGLLGSPHCVGMCGGIAGALAPGSQGGRHGVAASLGPALRLSAGRIASYTLLGALAGALGWVVGDLLGGTGTLVLRALFGALMVAVGLSLPGWLAGLGWLEAAGARVWERMSPALGALVPADRAWKQLAAGALWGWLPCGLVYAALAGAAASGSGTRGALWMACFGLGTLPAVAGMGVLAGRLSELVRGARTRQLAGAMLIAFGIWTAAGPLLMALLHDHAGVGSQQAQDAAAQDPRAHHH